MMMVGQVGEYAARRAATNAIAELAGCGRKTLRQWQESERNARGGQPLSRLRAFRAGPPTITSYRLLPVQRPTLYWGRYPSEAILFQGGAAYASLLCSLQCSLSPLAAEHGSLRSLAAGVWR